MAANLELLNEALKAGAALDEILVIDLINAATEIPVKVCVWLSSFEIQEPSVRSSIPEHAVQSSLPLFNLPDEEMKYDIHATSNFKGYNVFLSENADPEGRGDLNEGFNSGWEPMDGDKSEIRDWGHSSGPMGGRNIWPKEGGI